MSNSFTNYPSIDGVGGNDALLTVPVSTAWAASTSFVEGDMVTANSKLYRVTVGGTTGSPGTAPSHSSGDASHDGLTYRYISAYTLSVPVNQVRKSRVVDLLSCPLTGLASGASGAVSSIDTVLKAFERLETRVALNDAKTTGTGKVNLSGDIMTGRLQFSGTTHSGVRLNSLNTTQRDALTPAAGDCLFNTSTSLLEYYDGSSWVGGGASDPTKLPLAGGELSGQLKTINGTKSVPAISLNGTNNGFFFAVNLRVTIGSQEVFGFGPNGATVYEELGFSNTVGSVSSSAASIGVAGTNTLSLGGEINTVAPQTLTIAHENFNSADQTGFQWTFDASRSNGSGVGGGMRFRVSPAGSPGTTPNAYVTLFEMTGDQKIGFFGVTPVVQIAGWNPTNVTTTRTFDANATTVNELSDVVGTIINDLKSIGFYA